MKHLTASAVALSALLGASLASAQERAADPTHLPGYARGQPRLATTVVAAPTRRTQVIPMLSLRVAFGGGLALTPASGGDFVLRGTVGSRVFFPTRGLDSWVLGSDLGVEREWGRDQRGSTLLSLGPTTGHLWGLTGIAISPRVVYGWRDQGDTVWGVRTGVRVLAVGGVFDLELAHQYVTGALGDEHQMSLAIGMDLGIVAHVIESFGRPRARR